MTQGVNVVGNLRAESGVGEAARAVVAALDAAGVPVLPIEPPELSVSRQGVPFSSVDWHHARFAITVLCLTPSETPGFAAAVGPRFFAGRHTVGLWWWEVTSFPAALHPAFAHVDEVWVGSRHIAAAIEPPAVAAGVPVTQVRIPVRRADASLLTRAELGLPNGFLFLTVFGYYSSVDRKNPHGAIEAFRRAFAPGEGPSLVIKCIDEAAHPAEHAALLDGAAGHPDIHVLPGYVDRGVMDALVQRSDAVLSLHRAEGFGFTPAEAMALGKPVVVTAYSGTLDYVNDENAVLVPYELVPIGEGTPYPPDGWWADPDLDAAAAGMRRLVADPALAARLGERAAADMAAGWSAQAAGSIMSARLDQLPAGRSSWRGRRAAVRLLRHRVST